MAKTTKKRVAKKEVKEFPKFLAAEDLRRIDVLERDEVNAKLTMALEEQKLQNEKLVYQNAQYQMQDLERRMKAQKELVTQKSKLYETAKLKYYNFKIDLWPRYGYELKAGLGYDSETGEIKP